MRTQSSALAALAVAVAIWIGTAAAVQAQSCAGDCDGNGAVGINELVSAVNVALGVKEVGACLAADADRDGTVVISELVKAVASALGECAAATPTGQATHTATATDTATSPLNTHTMTPVPALTHTVTPPGTATYTYTATPTSGLTATITPTRTITPTVAPANLVGGVCRRPGAAGLVACEVGTAVRAYRCDNRLSCLSGTGRTKLGETQVTAQGRFAVGLNPALAPRNVLVLEADVAEATVYRIASAGRAASGAGAASAVGEAAGMMDGLELAPESEASTRIMRTAGLQNLPEEGLAEINAAVDGANAGQTFAGLTAAAAADRAEQNARGSGEVTFAVQQNRSGRLCEDTVWSAARSPFLVVRSVIVGGELCPAGQQTPTLTIEPGVEVRFREGDLFLQVRSTLIARGQPGNPIRFTSDQEFPVAGDWSGIVFEDTASDAVLTANGTYAGSGSIIEHATIEYAQGSAGRGALTLNSAGPLIKHVRLQRCSGSGALSITGDADVRVESVEIEENSVGVGLIASGGGGSLTVVDSRVSGAGISVQTQQGAVVVLDSAFEGSAGTGGFFAVGGQLLIRGSEFSNNRGTGVWIQFAGVGSQFVENSVRDNFEGIRPYFNLMVSKNLFSRNAGHTQQGLAGLFTGNCFSGDGSGSVDFRSATASNNTVIGAPVLVGSFSQLTGNNFLGTPFAVEAEQGISPPDIALPSNWWGFADIDIIASLTLDCEEESARKCVNFSPFAPGPIAAAPDIEDCANGILTPGTP